MVHFIHPGAAVPEIFFMPQQFAEHERDVARTAILAARRKPRTVHKIRIRHAQLPRALVHLLHKGALAAAQALCHCNAGIVCGCNADALEQVMDGVRGPRL